MLYKTEWLWELKTWSGKMTLMILQQILPTSSIETYGNNQQMRTYILILGFTSFILIFPRVYLSLLHDSRTGPRRTWKAIFVQGGLKSSRHEMRLCILQNKPYTWEKICNFLMHLRQGVSWGYVYIYIYLYIPSDFLKTNLTKLAVIWMKKGQKTLFLSPRSSKIIVTKQRERRKRKSEEKERRRRKKSNGCTLSFYK